MEVKGNIATPLEKRISTTSGKEYFTFRLAENHGRKEDANQVTTWFEIMAFNLSELDADLLSKGQFVRVRGRIEATPFMRKSGEPGAALKILAYKVEPAERMQRAAEGEGQ